MPCFRPLTAYRAPGGGVAFSSPPGFLELKLSLPCGQCRGCRLDRARDWAIRCVHEAQLHDRNSFITLTYDQANVPPDGGLDVRDWQQFAKRVRRGLGPFRFLHCGEYGGRTYRPHFHACVFGLDFDRRSWVKLDNGQRTSPVLAERWGLGQVTVGDVTFQSASYVARYIMQKAGGELALERYRRIDLATGEEYYVRPEYVTMSRRPGLGARWFERYHEDVYPSDFCVVDGKRHPVPSFYDDLLERSDPSALEQVKRGRAARASKLQEREFSSYCGGGSERGRASSALPPSPHVFSNSRLRVRDEVAAAKLTLFGVRDAV